MAPSRRATETKGGLAVLDALDDAPERGVLTNCLRCGKVYDCRTALNQEKNEFLHSGGVCVFCGTQVLLNGEPLSEAEVLGCADLGEAARSAEARAATLVAADKNSGARTHVHDDQADYFETSSDAWLTPEEKAELDRRQAEKERLEEENRRKVVVSIDLVGRRVVMDEPVTASSSGDVSSAGVAVGGAGGSGAAAGGAGASVPSELPPDLAGAMDAMAIADAPYGLGPAATAAAIERAVDAMSGGAQSMPAPDLPEGRAPLFVKPAKSVGVCREPRDKEQVELLAALKGGEGRVQHKDQTLADIARDMPADSLERKAPLPGKAAKRPQRGGHSRREPQARPSTEKTQSKANGRKAEPATSAPKSTTQPQRRPAEQRAAIVPPPSAAAGVAEPAAQSVQPPPRMSAEDSAVIAPVRPAASSASGSSAAPARRRDRASRAALLRNARS